MQIQKQVSAIGTLLGKTDLTLLQLLSLLRELERDWEGEKERERGGGGERERERDRNRDRQTDRESFESFFF